jgi:mannose-6-phosphate isomerase-like protein (cupin superfamily)
MSFKVTAADSQGALVIAEIAHHTPGGPPCHIHPQQDEWFYVAAGHYVVAAGDEQFDLGPGDSAFGPRGIPHTWAYVGGEPGSIVFAVSPAEQIEDFLRALSQMTAMAPQEPAFWTRFGMELVGPPLSL